MACHIGLAITTNLQSQICPTHPAGATFRLKNSRVLPSLAIQFKVRKVQRAMTSLKPARLLIPVDIKLAVHKKDIQVSLDKHLPHSPSTQEDQAMDGGGGGGGKREEEEEEERRYNSQKLDEWVRDSAVEIVHNLDEAPFLVHIYCNGNSTNGDGSPPKMRIKTVKEKAIADNWPMIEERWKGGRGIPNGVILVEELKTPLVVRSMEPQASS
ncbi:hypothetical protein Sango_0267200 [Sesamum angolense]|uniref:DUF7804 domain-containing protein n=1 Tax=Sesamum angolense TaxID=2727404 RepID=A0AAE2C2P2_9LAMI|nr:hypothetical protein Sango_0267200 [Sesamum angolense]